MAEAAQICLIYTEQDREHAERYTHAQQNRSASA